MARPKMNPLDRRSERVNVAFSPVELASLEAKARATNTNLAAFVRASAMSKKLKAQPPSSAPDFETRQELRRIGVNLNQIAKAMNARREAMPASLVSCCEKLETLFERWLLDDHSDSPRPKL